jgi:transcriptional regulator with XRE-family HTH domain
MSRSRVDTRGLVLALDAERMARGLSWRGLAKEIGVSASLLSRLNNGYKPDADGFATLVKWLRQPAESFITTDHDEATDPTRRESDLVAQLTPLLRAQRDLTEEDVRNLQEVLQASVRLARSRRAADQ